MSDEAEKKGMSKALRDMREAGEILEVAMFALIDGGSMQRYKKGAIASLQAAIRHLKEIP